MDLSRLDALHAGLSVPVSHYADRLRRPPYVVWAEDGETGSGGGDNRTTTRILSGTTDLFTKTADDPAVDEIFEAFAAAKIPCRLASVQYEDETGLVHYEWSWEVVLSPE